jgi:glyoxylase-like metal-dependent hydrolase (beta-lactamase superfamily II)/8-oxo-dGTP pyrophosphatase MutT (NUDIX family)
MTPLTPNAASVLLLRGRGDALEVYLCRRVGTARFLSGFSAFPGGSREPEDGDPADALGTARRTAAREALEEVGVALAPEALTLAGVWVAPAYLGVSLTTAFFFARADALSPRIVNAEHTHGDWTRPADALEAWSRGELLLAPPTLHLLRSLDAPEDGQLARCLAPPEAQGAPPRYAPIRTHITLFPVRTPTLPPATHTNCYVLHDADDLWVVDPASPYPQEQDELAAYIETHRAQGRVLRGIALTHAHHDHVGGVEALRAATGAPVFDHAEAARRLPFAVDRLLSDCGLLQVGRFAFDVVHTPGHDPGHVVFFDRATRAVIAGDLVAGLGTIVVDPDEGSMSMYLKSLARVRAMDPSALLPSHGGVIGGALEKLDEYLQHRLWREAKVLDALPRTAPATLETLLPAVYADVAPAALPIARLSLRAHLNKLVEDGRAAASAAGWSRTEPA